MNEMKIVVSDGALNGLTNYNELIAFAKAQIAPYENMLVTEDELSSAKDVMARMRKTAKAASDLRIRTEKEHAEKIALTVQQLKEISNTFTTAAAKIDTQVKSIVSARKQEKLETLKRYFSEQIGTAGKYIEFEDVEDEKWLNTSVTLDTAKKQMDEIISSFKGAVAAVESLEAEPGIKAAVEKEFMRTKSLAAAVQLKATLEQMAAAQRERQEREVKERAEREAALAEQRAKAEQQAQEQKTAQEAEKVQEQAAMPVEEVWEITFTVSGTRAQFAELKKFLVNNGMKYRKAV